MTGRVLLLTPSRGSGGGIERYAGAVEWAFRSEGIQCHRIDLHGSGPTAHVRMLSRAQAQLRADTEPARLVIAHRALLPVSTVVAAESACRGVSLICHGIDVWGSQPRLRRLAERYLMTRRQVRVVAVSNFTAGTLFADRPATILPPGLSRPWFDTLVDSSSAVRPAQPGMHLVTAFRLADWRNKGLLELLNALTRLGRPDVRLTVCGSGEPSPELRRVVERHRWCTLRAGLADEEMARELAAADLFVLATRTSYGRRASGEGFGMVLMEAQVAGTAVVAPAYGGSHEAFVQGVTGLAPTDESCGALARVLSDLLNDPARLEQMGKRAAEWARESFAPEIYAPLAVARLL